MRCRILAVLALLAGVTFALPASAQQTPAEVMRQWGLLGWWSLHCDRPVSPDNYYYGYVVEPGGKAFHARDLGASKINDRSEITTAELRADGTIAITINFTSFNQIRLVVFIRENERIRAFHNRGPGGDVSVEKGNFRNGQPTPWQYKCRADTAALTRPGNSAN